jgi:hypothetical protein
MHRRTVLYATIAAGLIMLAGGVFAEQNDCPVLQRQQEEQCRMLAERRQELCPTSEASPQCRQISEQIARQCTSRPCAPPSKRGKAKRTRTKGKKK